MDLRLIARLGTRPQSGPDLGILRRLNATGLIVLADKGYVGAGEHGRVPYKSRNKPASVVTNARAPGGRANAQLKTWSILHKLRCCPLLSGQLVKAILVLQLREAG